MFVLSVGAQVLRTSSRSSSRRSSGKAGRQSAGTPCSWSETSGCSARARRHHTLSPPFFTHEENDWISTYTREIFLDTCTMLILVHRLNRCETTAAARAAVAKRAPKNGKGAALKYAKPSAWLQRQSPGLLPAIRK